MTPKGIRELYKGYSKEYSKKEANKVFGLTALGLASISTSIFLNNAVGIIIGAGFFSVGQHLNHNNWRRSLKKN